MTVASGLHADRLTACAAIAMARPSRLEGRLLAILDPERNRRAISRWLALALLAAFTAAVVPLAMLRAGPPAEQEAAGASSPAAANDAQRDRAESFLALVEAHQFEKAAAAFSPKLVDVLPAEELERIWREPKRVGLVSLDPTGCVADS